MEVESFSFNTCDFAPTKLHVTVQFCTYIKNRELLDYCSLGSFEYQQVIWKYQLKLGLMNLSCSLVYLHLRTWSIGLVARTLHSQSRVSRFPT